MSLPDQMTDRWQNRPEPPPGEGVVSWHLLMRDYPEVVELARQAQQRLAGFDAPPARSPFADDERPRGAGSSPSERDLSAPARYARPSCSPRTPRPCARSAR